MEGACPISDHQSEHKHETYPQWFDWPTQSVHQFGGDRLSFEWDGCPNTHAIALKSEQQK
jgi:hypothetical protein